MSAWPPPSVDWDPSEGLLIGAEVAALYHVSPQIVSSWARNGKIPAIRTPGGDWRYSRRWVRENRDHG